MIGLLLVLGLGCSSNSDTESAYLVPQKKLKIEKQPLFTANPAKVEEKASSNSDKGRSTGLSLDVQIQNLALTNISLGKNGFNGGILESVKLKQSTLERCYQQQFQNTSEYPASVQMQFHIEKGGVEQEQVIGMDVELKNLHSCLMNTMNNWTFNEGVSADVMVFVKTEND